jgi:hypothetical protein
MLVPPSMVLEVSIYAGASVGPASVDTSKTVEGGTTT